MPDFENLGFQVNVDGADSAVSRLDKIIQRLDKLENTSLSVQKAQIALSNAQLSLNNSQKTYENALRSLTNAENARKNAIIAVENAEARLEAIRQNKKATATQLLLAENNLLSAQNSLNSATNTHLNAQQNVEKTLNNVEKSTNAVTKAELNLKNAQEKAKQATDKKVDSQKKEENQSKKTTKSLTSYITKLTSIVVLARKFAHFIGSAIKESANYIENLNLFAVAYGETYQQQLDWALGIAEAYGLANNEVIKFAGTFRELSTSLGLVGNTADLVSETVTKLGYDLSALFNTTVEQAMEKLQSGVFSGNVRPLRAYGIDISQNQIDALFETNEALRQLGVNARNLSQSDKVLARLIITLQSGKDSFGTMAREINNLQSQFRIFQGSIANFKLAIGDLVNKPLAEAMVYVNGFIIGITNVIRAFVPLTTEDKTPKFTGITEGAENANEELDKLQGKLASFDKFNVLQQGGGSSSSLVVTETLNKLLQEQASLYNNELSTALDNINNKATEIGKKIKDWFVVDTGKVDELGNAIYDLTNNAKLLGIALQETGIVLAYVFGKKMVLSIINFFTKYIINIQELRLQNALATTSFQKLQVALNAVVSGVLSLTMGIASLIMNWDNMTDASKFITIFVSLAAAIGAAAASLYLFKQNYAMAIGVAATVVGTGLTIGSQLGSIKGYAEGGYTNANLIMTHENGKREWVGKAAGSSAIVNDTQMSDIMEVAVAKGVYNALSARSDLNGGSMVEQPIIVKIGEQEVFTAVRKTAKKQGLGFANI